MKLVALCWPGDPITRKRSSKGSDKRWIIVGGHPAVHEEIRCTAQFDFFWWKKSWCSGAGAKQLPQGKVQIAIGTGSIVKNRLRVIRYRPCATSFAVSRHHQQELAQFLCAQ